MEEWICNFIFHIYGSLSFCLQGALNFWNLKKRVVGLQSKLRILKVWEADTFCIREVFTSCFTGKVAGAGKDWWPSGEQKWHSPETHLPLVGSVPSQLSKQRLGWKWGAPRSLCCLVETHHFASPGLPTRSSAKLLTAGGRLGVGTAAGPQPAGTIDCTNTHSGPV